MLKKLLAAALLLMHTSAFASGGFTWLGGIAHALHVPEHVVTLALVSVLILLMGIVYRIKVSNSKTPVIPDRGLTFRNFFEAIGEFIYKLTKNIMGEREAKKYFPMVVMVFSYIFINNTIGLIPGFLPPTENLNTTIAMGLFVFIYYNIQGIKEQGFVGHIKHFMGPVWYLAILIFPLEIISHSVRPISLGLRLKGNMQGDHMVLSIFSNLVPYFVPIPFYIIGLFVCFMQAFVFTLLTMVYISLATEHHDHGEEVAH